MGARRGWVGRDGATVTNAKGCCCFWWHFPLPDSASPQAGREGFEGRLLKIRASRPRLTRAQRAPSPLFSSFPSLVPPCITVVASSVVVAESFEAMMVADWHQSTNVSGRTSRRRGAAAGVPPQPISANEGTNNEDDGGRGAPSLFPLLLRGASVGGARAIGAVSNSGAVATERGGGIPSPPSLLSWVAQRRIATAPSRCCDSDRCGDPLRTTAAPLPPELYTAMHMYPSFSFEFISVSFPSLLAAEETCFGGGASPLAWRLGGLWGFLLTTTSDTSDAVSHNKLAFGV